MVEERKEKKEMKEEKPKQSMFSKWKKLAVGGLLGLSMIMPMKNAEGYVFFEARGPAEGEYATHLNSKYPEGWRLIQDIDERQTNSENTIKLTVKALEYFEMKYKQSKDEDALYLLAYSYYQRATDSDDIVQAESFAEKALRLCEEKTKNETVKLYLLDLKIVLSFNLGQAFWNEYRQLKLKTYKIKAKTYLEEGINTYGKYKNKIYFKTDQEKMEKLHIQPAKRILESIE